MITARSVVAFLLLTSIYAQKPPDPKPAAPQENTAPANLLGRVNTQAGEARRNENIFINALDNNAQRESSIRLGMTATAISEFTAASRYFGAELGVAPINPFHVSATKAQSALHGNLFYTHANSIFAARSFFQVGGVLPARENTLGGRVTIPLWRNAWLGLDGSYDSKRGFVNGNILVPRPEERTCLSTNASICATINRFFQAWPNQAPNRLDMAARALNTNAPQAIDTSTTSARFDQVLGKHRITARHSWTNQQVDAFQLVAGQNPDTTTKSHDARLTYTFVKSARTNLDATLGFVRNSSLLVPEPNAVGPQVQIGTAFDKLGPASGIPVDRVQNRYRLGTRMQHQAGKHTISFGFEYGRLQFNGREVSSNRGNYYFRNDFGLDAITNFRLGNISRYSFAIGELDRGFRRHEYAAFVQDTWRFSPALTLTAGLRYQPQTGISEVNNITPIPFNCDCNNFAPNLGIAWRIPRNLGLLRVNYSTQFGELPPATLQQLRWNPPAFQKIENQAPPFLNLLEGVVFNPNGRAIFAALDPNLKTPYSHQYSATWQLPLSARKGRLDLSYIGSRTWKLLYLLYLNRALPVPGIPQTTATINDRRPDKRYFDYRNVENSARAYYDAAKATYTLTSNNGWLIDVTYWFSKAIDTGSTFVSIAAGDDAQQGHGQVADNVSADLRGLSNFHQTHSFINRVSYQLAYRNALIRNWRASTVFVAKSGTPFTVITGSDGPGLGNVDGVSGDRPNIVTPEILGRTISHPDLAPELLPRSAFAFIRPGEPRGNLGMTTFFRAGFRNLNASIERRFTLKQDYAIAFRAETINGLNTPQFAEPVADLSNPAFGKITNTLNDGRTFRFSLSLEF
ncbi:MAG: hypothetical protein FJW36_20730 [Acidobacteria bacterium]|nr:hypothetical protein [Acidobacteriota bacterium]